MDREGDVQRRRSVTLVIGDDFDTSESAYPAQRAFTAPSSHNLNGSPYPTPSNPLIEPVLRSPTSGSSPSSAYTTPLPLTRILSPDAPPGSVDIEHRPRKGDGYNSPPSPWRLFRQKYFKNSKEHERLYPGYAPRDSLRNSLRNDIHELWMALAETQNKLVNGSSQIKSVSFDIPSSSRLCQSSSLSPATDHQGGSDDNGANFTTRNDGNFNLTLNNVVLLSCEPDQLQTVERVCTGVLQLRPRTTSTTPTITRAGGTKPNMHED
uniref:Uncharacterized protein n=1 Tax=Moniliophthora roreri TaxID=221103 RepID=A0A0W0EW31_MONRR